MGQFLAKANSGALVSDPVLVQYRKVSHAQIYESYGILKDVHNGKHSLEEDEFDEVFGFWLGDSEPHFHFWCNKKGKVDCFETFCGTIVYAEGQFEDKINFIFNFFDFDRSGSITIDELTILIMSCVRGMCRLAGLPIVLDAAYMSEIEATARSAFLQMDTDKSKSISKEEFAAWVLSNADIMNYVQNFTGGTNIFSALQQHQAKMQTCASQFQEAQDSDKSCALEKVIEIMRNAMNDPSDDEVKDITSALGSGRVSVELFLQLISAMISFDLVDRNGSHSLDVKEVRALLWLIHGKEPQPKLVETEMQQLDEDKSGEVSRREFVKYMCVSSSGKDGGAKIDLGLKKIFDKYDADGTGTINKDEFSLMIHETLSSQVGEHITDFGKTMLESMARDTANELLLKVDADGSGTIEWNELKKHIGLLYEKEKELMEWLREYQTNHISRIQSFDKDGNQTIELPELQQLLMDSLKLNIKYGQITMDQANTLTSNTGKKILKGFGQPPTGSITHQELNAHYSKIVKLEKEMLAEVAVITSGGSIGSTTSRGHDSNRSATGSTGASAAAASSKSSSNSAVKKKAPAGKK